MATGAEKSSDGNGGRTASNRARSDAKSWSSFATAVSTGRLSLLTEAREDSSNDERHGIRGFLVDSLGDEERNDEIRGGAQATRYRRDLILYCM